MIGACAQAPVGCDVYDAARRLEQVRQGGPAQVERHVEVDMHRIPPVVVAGPGGIAPDEDARAVHQAIDTAEFVDRVRDEFLACVRGVEITFPGSDVVGRDGDFVQPCRVPSCRHDRPAGIGKLDGRRGAYARACSGNERDLHDVSLARRIVLCSVYQKRFTGT